MAKQHSIPMFSSHAGSQKQQRAAKYTRIAGVFVFVIAILGLGHTLTTQSKSLQLKSSSSKSWFSNAKYPFSSSIIVNVKTGVTIAAARVSIQALDRRPQIPERVYYADAAFKLGDIQVQDAYSQASEEIKKQPVFQTYFKVQEFMLSNYVPRGGHDFWALSRYIDTQIQGLAWRDYPNKDWYMTVDDDTYVFWDTTLRWLASFNPNEQAWLGHYDNNQGTIFANGGSGYAISGKMMRDIFASDPLYSNNDPEFYTKYDAGDTRLGKALTSHPNMLLKRPSAGDPSFNTERPRWISYSPTTWYLPVLTLGHMDAPNMNVARHVEERIAIGSGQKDDVRFCDLYNAYVPLELPFLKWDSLNAESDADASGQPRWIAKTKWRNNPRFTHQRDIDSVEACKLICENEVDCYSFTFFDRNPTKKCHTSRLGVITFGEEEDGITSFWDLHKISQGMGKMTCTDKQRRAEGWEISLNKDGKNDLVT